MWQCKSVTLGWVGALSGVASALTVSVIRSLVGECRDDPCHSGNPEK